MTPKKPWASLVGRLKHPELQLQPFDERVARHKATKYGRVDNVESGDTGILSSNI